MLEQATLVTRSLPHRFRALVPPQSAPARTVGCVANQSSSAGSFIFLCLRKSPPMSMCVGSAGSGQRAAVARVDAWP